MLTQKTLEADLFPHTLRKVIPKIFEEIIFKRIYEFIEQNSGKFNAEWENFVISTTKPIYEAMKVKLRVAIS